MYLALRADELFDRSRVGSPPCSCNCRCPRDKGPWFGGTHRSAVTLLKWASPAGSASSTPQSVPACPHSDKAKSPFASKARPTPNRTNKLPHALQSSSNFIATLTFLKTYLSKVFSFIFIYSTRIHLKTIPKVWGKLFLQNMYTFIVVYEQLSHYKVTIDLVRHDLEKNS